MENADKLESRIIRKILRRCSYIDKFQYKTGPRSYITNQIMHYQPDYALPMSRKLLGIKLRLETAKVSPVR